MMANSSLLWSPWFRIIAERFLAPWWDDLEAAITTGKFVDIDTIHRFDCTAEHLGGAGGAGSWLSAAPGTAEEDLVAGDKWLPAVAANGGKAPASVPMKSSLVQDSGNRWSLNSST